MKKVKFLFAIIVFVIFFQFLPVKVFALEEENEEAAQIASQAEKEIEQAIDEETKEDLENQGITFDDTSSAGEIEPKNVFSSLWEYFKNALQKPVQIFVKILSISLICAAIKGMVLEDELGRILNIIGILSIVLVISDIISENFESLTSSIERINNFMTAYIPIFSGILTAGGYSIAGAGYTSSMLLISETVSIIISKFLMPFLTMILGITLVCAINPSLKFASLAESIKKCVIWVLTFLMSIFVGIISIQSITGAASDNMAVKTLKFAANSFIPVIGNYVSEAYSAVRGSFSVIRTGLGSLGIIIVFIIAVKPILSILAIKLTFWLGSIVNDMFGQQEVSGFLKSVNSILSIGLAIVIAYAIVFIISTAALLTALG